jgi:hypothetical protein
VRRDFWQRRIGRLDPDVDFAQIYLGLLPAQ